MLAFIHVLRKVLCHISPGSVAYTEFFTGEDVGRSFLNVCIKQVLGVGSIPSGSSIDQCHFQNLVLFQPHRTLEHNKILTSRPPVALTEHLL